MVLWMVSPGMNSAVASQSAKDSARGSLTSPCSTSHWTSGWAAPALLPDASKTARAASPAEPSSLATRLYSAVPCRSSSRTSSVLVVLLTWSIDDRVAPGSSSPICSSWSPITTVPASLRPPVSFRTGACARSISSRPKRPPSWPALLPVPWLHAGTHSASRAAAIRIFRWISWPIRTAFLVGAQDLDPVFPGDGLVAPFTRKDRGPPGPVISGPLRHGVHDLPAVLVLGIQGEDVRGADRAVAVVQASEPSLVPRGQGAGAVETRGLHLRPGVAVARQGIGVPPRAHAPKDVKQRPGGAGGRGVGDAYGLGDWVGEKRCLRVDHHRQHRVAVGRVDLRNRHDVHVVAVGRGANRGREHVDDGGNGERVDVRGVVPGLMLVF